MTCLGGSQDTLFDFKDTKTFTSEGTYVCSF